MGFLVSQHGQLRAITPPPFLSGFPLGEHAKWRCDTPPQKGYLSDAYAIPHENKALGAIPPSAILSQKGIARYGGGISHWAAKIYPSDATPFSAKQVVHWVGVIKAATSN